MSSNADLSTKLAQDYNGSSGWLAPRNNGIMLTDPNPLSERDGVPGSFSCNIGAEMTGITRVSLSFAGVFLPKKD